MSMTLEIAAKSGYLYVTVMGRFSLEEAKRTFEEILEAVARSRVGKVLLDGRGVVGSPELMERFYYSEFAAKSVAEFAHRGVSRDTQFAYVLEVPMRDPRRFGEIVAANRAMLIKTFNNINDARAWLGIAPASNTDVDDGSVRNEK